MAMTDPGITDQPQRAAALDPARSFIVQAPAGSGKTELLTQRYLRLLALVEHPEEIAAITFTRKAAAEMRNRVLAALDDAAQAEPQESHKQTTWRLARAVAEQDRRRAWHLRDNPNRLRIQTFDSLAAELTRQMPILAETGAPPGVQENADSLYRQAARAALGALDDSTFGPHLARVLRHLDNRLGQLEDLLSNMLGRRDQWLPHVLGGHKVAQLEQALRIEIEQRLQQVDSLFPAHLMAELVRLAGWAADNLPGEQRADNPIALWAGRKFRPAASWEELPLWLGLAGLLLKQDGELRKQLNKNQGFPAPGEKGLDAASKALRKQAKEEMAALLGEVAAEQELVAALGVLPGLPAQGYSEAQAAVLESLTQCLLRAAAELQLVFVEHGEVDFVELGQRALRALGSEDQPTDLALALDYRLKHLLVDEFQDTSSSQHRLLRLLTAGWQADDGRSLLLVGDPMQSIYRFREAEVGLYLRTREVGLGGLPLQPLTLEMNFRSQAGVVEWVNAAFARMFPRRGDAARGAVPYAHSSAARPAQPFPAVQVHGRIERDDAQEAQQIAALIGQTLHEHPQDDIAVLARSRSHLAHIAAALKAAGIGFAAVDVDPLGARPVVQDLRTLTRALLHPADRLAWLALLRAPWLGLALPDLLHLAEHSEQAILRRLQDPALLQTLSTDARQRVQRLLRVLGNELPARGRLPLRSWIEGIWLALGGLAVAGESGHADAQAFLALLEQLEQPGSRLDFAELDQQVAGLYAAPDSQADGRVQIMTMHGAKGLEFDTVILPGLGKRPRSNDSELLYWAEIPDTLGDAQLLMAPIRARRETSEPISDFIRGLNQEKDRLESVRLLYVAATRARQRLHLFGHVQLDKNNHPRPTANTLLDTLWPVVDAHFQGLHSAESGPTDIPRLLHTEQRLPAAWQLQLPSPAHEPAAPTLSESAIDFEWAGDTARHVGTLVHRYLERIATQGLAQWPVARLDGMQPQLEAALANLGVDPQQMQKAAHKTLRALRNTLSHEQGRWILASHAQHACELPLTVHDQTSRHYVIDRTFVDDEGTRWIIDYKTGEHLEEDVEAFLDAEQERYREQLENYARILQLIENRPTQVALYFPLLGAWRVWQPRGCSDPEQHDGMEFDRP
jgi:ATP-dependent exoDNAse (exonuclease V) beta subunit